MTQSISMNGLGQFSVMDMDPTDPIEQPAVAEIPEENFNDGEQEMAAAPHDEAAFQHLVEFVKEEARKRKALRVSAKNPKLAKVISLYEEMSHSHEDIELIGTQFNRAA